MLCKIARRFVRMACPLSRWERQYPGLDWSVCLANRLHARRNAGVPFMVHFTSRVTGADRISFGRNIWKQFAGAAGCRIHGGGGLSIGDDTLWAVHLTVSSPEATAPVRIGTNVWLGAHVRVLPGVTIGDHATVAANSVVTGDLPPLCVAGGRPAKVIKMLSESVIAGYRSRRGISQPWGGEEAGAFRRAVESLAPVAGQELPLPLPAEEAEMRPAPGGGVLRNWFYQHLIGLNSGAPFPVHFTSRVQDAGNIRLGAGAERSFARSANCYITATGGLEIGEGAEFGNGVVIQTTNHDLWNRSLNTVEKPVKIGRRVRLGDNTTVTAGVSIGDGAVILPGSAVTADIPAGATAGGVPCRVLEIKA